ncbi:uncharacterized protein LOC130725458 [Lotus japonicus]|uniref:uncharacterized protein LOC130725458 n=1 Tax=Lotus japonicus TaxID=34305 RepID=UPI002585EDDC|nr:uncharacterized protein LOC130725458 [Lotus japonicus]
MCRREDQSRVQHGVGRSGGSFSVFIDGLSDGVTKDMVTAIFAKAGVLTDVFVQFKRREGRQFRFGFVRFQKDMDARRAIRMFNGMKFRGAFLTVKRARYQVNRGLATSPLRNDSRLKFAVRGKVWKPKVVVQEDTQMRMEDELNSNVSYSLDEEDVEWVNRCACATMHGVQSMEAVWEKLKMFGLVNMKLKVMGARDVLLEFESNTEMQATLSEAKAVLDEIFEWFGPCSKLLVGKSQLVWVRVWRVPVGAWNHSFFVAIGNTLGHFVCVDGITARKERLDFGRLLVITANPLIEQHIVVAKIDGECCEVMVEKEMSKYQDWSGLRQEVKNLKKADSSNSEDQISEMGMEDQGLIKMVEEVPAGKHAVVEVLQHLKDAGYGVQ